jgi:hypothetical protein
MKGSITMAMWRTIGWALLLLTASGLSTLLSGCSGGGAGGDGTTGPQKEVEIVQPVDEKGQPVVDEPEATTTN